LRTYARSGYIAGMNFGGPGAPEPIALAIGGLSGPEALIFFVIYFGGIGAAVFFFLRALWRIGDGLLRISRAIESRQPRSDAD